jgi:hypothetical protein
MTLNNIRKAFGYPPIADDAEKDTIEEVGHKPFFSIDEIDTMSDDIEDYMRNETQLVLVECIQQYRMRYVVEVPVLDNPEWATDTVAMNEAEEFSQYDLGETIISHRIVTKDEVLRLCDKDNDYCKSWTDEKKLDSFVTLIGNKK